MTHEARLVFGRGHDEHAVRHDTLRHARAVDLVAHLVAQETADKHVDAAVERGAEQHPLAALRRRRENARDTGEESEVSHVIGLVEHRDLDGAEVDDLLLHEVFEASGARDDDVDAAAERLLLRLLAHAAEDRHDREAGGIRERDDGRRDLRRELARRGEHEAARASGRAAGGRGSGQSGDERKRERDGLARAGAAAAEHIAPRKSVRQRVALDGEGLRLAG